MWVAWYAYNDVAEKASWGHDVVSPQRGLLFSDLYEGHVNVTFHETEQEAVAWVAHKRDNRLTQIDFDEEEDVPDPQEFYTQEELQAMQVMDDVVHTALNETNEEGSEPHG